RRRVLRCGETARPSLARAGRLQALRPAIPLSPALPAGAEVWLSFTHTARSRKENYTHPSKTSQAGQEPATSRACVLSHSRSGIYTSRLQGSDIPATRYLAQIWSERNRFRLLRRQLHQVPAEEASENRIMDVAHGGAGRRCAHPGLPLR